MRTPTSAILFVASPLLLGVRDSIPLLRPAEACPMGYGRRSDHFEEGKEELRRILERGAAALKIERPSTHLRRKTSTSSQVGDAKAASPADATTTKNHRRLPTDPHFPMVMPVRSYDGSEGTGGAAHTLLARQSTESYADGASAMRVGANPRTISNTLCDDEGNDTQTSTLTAMAFAWGQFLDHDISLSEPPADNAETIWIDCEDMQDELIADGDASQCIEFTRSDGVADASGVRQQLNEITSWIDASMVYGSDATRANALRTIKDGKLKSTTIDGKELLPFNIDHLPNAGGEMDETLFVAGDIRVNEQAGLTSMHTLFVREHNRLAGLIKKEWSTASDEDIYQLARKIVGAEIQKITYEEFLPALVGPLPAYEGYNQDVDGSIMNEFSTAAFRFGHTLLPETLVLAKGSNVTGGIMLSDAFFSPDMLAMRPELVDELIHGFVVASAQPIDHILNDSVRRFLFGQPGEGGTDLASLNIQRGRDHGLPGCNTVRQAFGLDWMNSLSKLTSDHSLRTELHDMYGPKVEDIDVWLCGLVEDPVTGSQLGELFTTIIKEQFQRLRDGDEFYWENDTTLQDPALSPIIDMQSISLAEIIELNTGMAPAAQNVFEVGLLP